MCKHLAGAAPGLPGAAIRFGANVETISFGGKQMLTLETKLKELGLQAGEIFKDRFVFYRSFADQLERLSDKPEIVVALVRATYRYGLDMQEPDFGGDVVLEALFAPIKAQLDANWVRTLNGTNGKEYGIKGGRPTGDKNPTKTPPEPQENPTEPPNIKGKIKGKGKGNVNGKENPNPSSCLFPSFPQLQAQMQNYPARDAVKPYEIEKGYSAQVVDKWHETRTNSGWRKKGGAVIPSDKWREDLDEWMAREYTKPQGQDTQPAGDPPGKDFQIAGYKRKKYD